MTDESKTEEMIYMMKKISLHLSAQLELNLKDEELSGTQVYLLVYILRHHPEGTYLTELCREIEVSKPTLSALMKKLREKGYLYFQENPKDVRKKKVLPTEKLLARKERYLNKASRMEFEICSALEPQERRQLWNLEQKILAHFAGMEQNEKNTDRRFYYREKSITTA